MVRTSLYVVVAGFLMLAPAAVRAHQTPAPQGSTEITATDAAPYLGEWTLTMEGANGPGTFALAIRADKETGKVTADITNDATGKLPISTISRTEKSLVLGYSFTWEGNPVDAVVSLTPDKEGKTAAQIDFAGGAYVMTGTATKKEPAK